ncbi:P-loop containing nucleoside triphosphate hydrolase protein [Thelonectria olida]|uniref:P-loop containing nucleoside triphosphate hydrolase protein n=1 Tax=Thelonectria olida TaxID=1576542 RepID=A0A9P9ANF8_9HYPO|nr:P-loop containing nucleoside triphosphate hydrolase protein [Thelonectria olida]
MDKLSKQSQDTNLEDPLLCSILSEKPNIKWDDIAGLESAKSELQAAIIFILRFPQMFRGNRLTRPNILLYGPPGTGKSHLAKAVATEVDRTLFTVNMSDIMSKWTGELEEFIRQLFQLARDKKPSIIFLDGIDAIFRKRDGPSADLEHTVRIKTEFLIQIDSLAKNKGVFILAATNLPWALDSRVCKRFQKRIHIPLPDQRSREELFKAHLGDMAPTLVDNKQVFVALAEGTGGYSGRDIAGLIQDALMTPIKKVHSATHFRKTRDRDGEWYTPCSPDAEDATPMHWNQVPGHQLKEPPLLIEDLYDAVKRMKPSVREEEARKCVEWTQDYGMEGA